MTTAVVDSPKSDQDLESGFCDALVVEHREPETDTVVFETSMPVGSTPALSENIQLKRRSRRVVARWIPDPRGEQNLICSWVPQNGGSVGFQARSLNSATGF